MSTSKINNIFGSDVASDHTKNWLHVKKIFLEKLRHKWQMVRKTRPKTYTKKVTKFVINELKIIFQHRGKNFQFLTVQDSILHHDILILLSVVASKDIIYFGSWHMDCVTPYLKEGFGGLKKNLTRD